jgi:secernin
MVVARGRATVDGRTLFGQNLARPAGEGHRLCRTPGREFSPGEKVHTQYIEIPQVRQAFTVLGWRPDPWWGYAQGVNERGVVLGCAVLGNQWTCPEPGLTGGDLVRLALERAPSACKAVDVIGSLVERHGQSAPPGNVPPPGSDNSFLIADAAEAFALETAGRHWVCQEIEEVRAAGNVTLIRQDWDHISRGLASEAIAQGLWPADGSKIDFAGTLSVFPTGQASGLRRWGRATLLLEQQNGHVETPFLRRLLSDHYEGTHFEVDPRRRSPGPVPLCRHGQGGGGCLTAASAIFQLGGNRPQWPILWYAFGSPCEHVYFPLFLDGDLPQAYTLGSREGAALAFWQGLSRIDQMPWANPRRWEQLRDDLGRLQNRIDQEAEDFAEEGLTLERQGNTADLPRRATALMEHHLELFEATLGDLALPGRKAGEFRSELASYFI